MKVIFDTSVWIEYFKGSDGYHERGQELIEKRTVYTIEAIFAELLQGALNRREVEIISDYYELIPKVAIYDLLVKAGMYSSKEKLTSKGIGLIDAAIILSTIESNAKLWTLDKKIKRFLSQEHLYDVD